MRADQRRLVRTATFDLAVRRHRDATCDPRSVAVALNMSRRQLYRAFDGGSGPALMLGDLRVGAAVVAFAVPGARLDDVASVSGFGSRDGLHRHLSDRLGASPGHVRGELTTCPEACRTTGTPARILASHPVAIRSLILAHRADVRLMPRISRMALGRLALAGATGYDHDQLLGAVLESVRSALLEVVRLNLL